jgi:hypothetical protein
MALLIVVALATWRAQLGPLIGTNLPTILIAGALIVFAASYAVRIGPVLVLGVASGTVRHAVLDGARSGGMIHVLIASLTVADYVRIALYLALLIGLEGWVLVYAWRRRRLRFLRFVVGAGIGLVVATAIRPSAVALMVSNFQSSARFVWVVIYLVSLVAIAGVWRTFRPPMAISVLTIALGLQVADTAPLWRALQNDAKQQPAPFADEAEIGAAVAQAQAVNVVPTYLCAYAEPIEEAERNSLLARIVDLQVLVSQWSRPINSVQNARMTATNVVALSTACAAERTAALSRSDTPGVLTLVFDGAPAEAELRRLLAGRPECRAIVTGELCFHPVGR